MFGDLIHGRNQFPKQSLETSWKGVGRKIQEKIQAKGLYCSFAEEADELVIEVCQHLTLPLGSIVVEDVAKPRFSLRAGLLSIEEFKIQIGWKG
jgi:hypothetical protein